MSIFWYFILLKLIDINMVTSKLILMCLIMFVDEERRSDQEMEWAAEAEGEERIVSFIQKTATVITTLIMLC